MPLLSLPAVLGRGPERPLSLEAGRGAAGAGRRGHTLQDKASPVGPVSGEMGGPLLSTCHSSGAHLGGPCLQGTRGVTAGELLAEQWRPGTLFSTCSPGRHPQHHPAPSTASRGPCGRGQGGHAGAEHVGQGEGRGLQPRAGTWSCGSAPPAGASGRRCTGSPAASRCSAGLKTRGSGPRLPRPCCGHPHVPRPLSLSLTRKQDVGSQSRGLWAWRDRHGLWCGKVDPTPAEGGEEAGWVPAGLPRALRHWPRLRDPGPVETAEAARGRSWWGRTRGLTGGHQTPPGAEARGPEGCHAGAQLPFSRHGN